ncbi:MAG: pseudouridine-5'-phosphate glycosidase, partial [Acidobacteria bacterium]|nr:pseudouridine-5'-phosphate glycosidase [Acidobacteriota bacterium]
MAQKPGTTVIVSSEVEEALAEGRVVVALESTVIAHGLPRPQNLETALRLEQIVRSTGAVPATIAILKGRLCVGLDVDQLKHLAASDSIHKISRRDLAVAVAREWDGATTVAATIWIANQAGIAVFATGGIGGVHRGSLPDVSADLPELARTPIVVVCSGAKIVLDLPATREWLETYGITVIGYGCDEMPAFYSSRSGLAIDARADSPREAAMYARARHDLGTKNSILITVPVPASDEVPASVLQESLDRALIEANTSGIGGRELTPFLLKRLGELTEGATLRANISLLENNARVAGEIARALVIKDIDLD